MRRKVKPDIMQAAIKLFGLHTYKGVTTRALAKEARVQEPSLYAWFTNKENIYLQAVNTVIAQTNQEFTKFMFTMFGGAEEPTPARVVEALRTWCASIPGPNARLLVQVLVSDDKHSSIAREPLEQIVNTLARTLERQKKANRKFSPHAAAKTLVRALLWGKVIESKTAEHDMDEVLQQFLLTLGPA
jgi:AcrR family transcriptional regulator